MLMNLILTWAIPEEVQNNWPAAGFFSLSAEYDKFTKILDCFSWDNKEAKDLPVLCNKFQ